MTLLEKADALNGKAKKFGVPLWGVAVLYLLYQTNQKLDLLLQMVSRLGK